MLVITNLPAACTPEGLVASTFLALALHRTGVGVGDGVFCSGELLARPMPGAERTDGTALRHVSTTVSDHVRPNRFT